MQHKMPMVCIENVHVHLRIHIYIRRGLQCCCLDVKAIPEPYEAEQQDCSPAFLFVKLRNTVKSPAFCLYIRANIKIIYIMKKLISLFLAFAASVVTMMASEPNSLNATISQDCNQNGINAALAENLSLQSISANVNGHAYVDLGLPSGNLWATCNLGAQDSTGIGDYYAWGELTTKTSYTNATYQYQDWYGTQAYVYLGDEISGTQYDVAKHIYGGDWRFPTAEEAREYPWCIIGTVSAVPTYETWGQANVKVNGRIWIRIR